MQQPVEQMFANFASRWKSRRWVKERSDEPTALSVPLQERWVSLGSTYPTAYSGSPALLAAGM
jgi:hypothetical protein